MLQKGNNLGEREGLLEIKNIIAEMKSSLVIKLRKSSRK